MKIICPFHEEDTPSCHLYPDGYKCFGCGRSGQLSELGDNYADYKPSPKFIENLSETRKYIENLPKKEIRGFTFPYDSSGFYITWPDSAYYKQRLFLTGPDQPRYRNPSGHKQPIFWARRGKTAISSTLFAVEGELNALSLASSALDGDVCSPGAASQFENSLVDYLLTNQHSYNKLIIVVDNDSAGVIAAISAKGRLADKIPFITIKLMDKDCNQILTESGVEALAAEITRKKM